MSAHIDADGDCPLAVVPCKYNDFGCKYKVYSRFSDLVCSIRGLFLSIKSIYRLSCLFTLVNLLKNGCL